MSALGDLHEHHLTTTSHDISRTSQVLDQTFPLLALPFELRLKIYAYILPPRRHIIVTSLPTNGFFYNTFSFINTSSAYPFGNSAPLNSKGLPQAVPYKVLSANQHAGFPHSRISPAILRTCRQVLSEAEPVLYVGKGVEWDFGVHLEALRSFFDERSDVARRCVRNLRIAFELPVLAVLDDALPEAKGRKALVWDRMVEYVRKELTDLRHLELVLWSGDGSGAGFPTLPATSTTSSSLDRYTLHIPTTKIEEQWRSWAWTKDLLAIPSMRETKITYWTGQERTKEEVSEDSFTGAIRKKFDSWIAGRMVGDFVMRGRMIEQEIMREDVIVLRSR